MTREMCRTSPLARTHRWGNEEVNSNIDPAPVAQGRTTHPRQASSFSVIQAIRDSASAGPRPGLVRRSAVAWLGATYVNPSRTDAPTNTPSSFGSISKTLAPASADRSQSSPELAHRAAVGHARGRAADPRRLADGPPESGDGGGRRPRLQAPGLVDGRHRQPRAGSTSSNAL